VASISWSAPASPPSRIAWGDCRGIPSVARQTVNVDQLRDTIADAIRARVVGPDRQARTAELFAAPGPRWFSEDRPIRRVHGDASMFVGGLRALLLQSMHPVAMAAVAAHSDYRNDPWGRLQRTADFLAAVSFGPADQAQRAVDRVKHVHGFVTGTTRDGIEYRANDPHLLLWVHVTEVESFLVAHDRFGHAPLQRTDRDGYVADMAAIAEALGVSNPPRTVEELASTIRRYRPELRAIREARQAARFILFPPIEPIATPFYASLSAAAVSSLPWWARLPLGLPFTPIADTTLARPLGRAVVSFTRWAMTPGAPTATGAAP
jgi:uncharacterized protein (DUF2236 family)